MTGNAAMKMHVCVQVGGGVQIGRPVLWWPIRAPSYTFGCRNSPILYVLENLKKCKT